MDSNIIERPPTSTPWGQPQQQRRIADGITEYSTASHGGLHLSSERLEAMPSELRRVPTWVGDAQWFEEDVDWTLVALAFPNAFEPRAVAHAVRAVNGYRQRLQSDPHARTWTPAIEWLDGPDAATVLKIADDWLKSVGDSYEICAAGTIPTRHLQAVEALAKANNVSASRVSWYGLRRINGPGYAEILCLPGDPLIGVDGLELSSLPDDRIVSREN